MAKERGIAVPAIEHASSNDVEAIRTLLQQTNTPADPIYKSTISPGSKIQKRKDFSKLRTESMLSSPSAAIYSLYWEAATLLLQDGFVYLMDGENMTVKEAVPGYCYFKARHMKYKVIPS